jgi:hypothetical protein
MTPDPETYGYNIADQVFAVVPQLNGSFAVGSWVRWHNSLSGKSYDDVERYSTAPGNEDRMEKLSGSAALSWERQLCAETNVVIQPSRGLDSTACRDVLLTEVPRHIDPK